ncbi:MULTISPECIES: sensor histidine kinase [unclassified Streptomyces]|uniref:sensor histidine kinase n=1 Tax=Streptomyces sp. NPDC058441 TaxID=3346502 RepID=UPI00365B1727
MSDVKRVRAGALVEAMGTVLLVAVLAIEVVTHSLTPEFTLSLAAGVLFLVAAFLSTEDRRSWLLIISGTSLVIAVALLVRITEAPLLSGLHLVPLTMITCAGAIGRRSALRRRVLDREWSQARRAGEERERRRWARELHDDTLQNLGAVQIMLATAVADNNPGRTKEAIEQARGLIGNQITSLRHLIAELRPAALDQLGLQPALEALCRSTAEIHGIDAEIRAGPRWDHHSAELSPEAQAHVYRIAQEAVTNAVKHARPTKIAIELSSDDHTLVTKITDNGQGWSPAPATTPTLTPQRLAASGGMGIATIRERAQLLHARLTVDSAPHEGTRITLQIPRHGKKARGLWS